MTKVFPTQKGSAEIQNKNEGEEAHHTCAPDLVLVTVMSHYYFAVLRFVGVLFAILQVVSDEGVGMLAGCIMALSGLLLLVFASARLYCISHNEGAETIVVFNMHNKQSSCMVVSSWRDSLENKQKN